MASPLTRLRLAQREMVRVREVALLPFQHDFSYARFEWAFRDIVRAGAALEVPAIAGAYQGCTVLDHVLVSIAALAAVATEESTDAPH